MNSRTNSGAERICALEAITAIAATPEANSPARPFDELSPAAENDASLAVDVA